MGSRQIPTPLGRTSSNFLYIGQVFRDQLVHCVICMIAIFLGEMMRYLLVKIPVCLLCCLLCSSRAWHGKPSTEVKMGTRLNSRDSAPQSYPPPSFCFLPLEQYSHGKSHDDKQKLDLL